MNWLKMNTNNHITPGSIIERIEEITLFNEEAQRHLSSFCRNFHLFVNSISNVDAVAVLASFEFFLRHFMHNDETIRLQTDLSGIFITTQNASCNTFWRPHFFNDSNEEAKQLNNQISKLRIENNILFNRLKTKESECLRISELTDYHVKLLDQVNKINRHFILKKSFRNTKRANATSQTEIVLHKNKNVQCNIVKNIIEKIQFDKMQIIYSNLYGMCDFIEEQLKLENMAEFNIFVGWLLLNGLGDAKLILLHDVKILLQFKQKKKGFGSIYPKQ